MAARFALLLAMVVMASGLESLSFDVEAAKARPVSKVINLLKDMKKELEAEGEADEEIYEKMVCWCETNDKEKTKAIADADQKISDLTTLIEELSATSARIQEEIKNLEGELDKNQKAMDKATAMRFKGLDEFNAEEKDLLQAISALKAAIVVLSKHHAAFLQQASSAVEQAELFRVATVMQHELKKHAALFEGVFTKSQRKMVAAFIQSPEDYFDASPTFKQSYAPASGQILGILKQMKETFESNLSQTQKDELSDSEGYESTKAAKENEMAAGKDQIEDKVQELADTDEKLATAKQDLEDTEAQKAADEKFLANLREQCKSMDAEMEERTKTRQLEIEAVSKALEILSSDDAHDLFTKTFSFLATKQQSRSYSKRREMASKLLAAVARRNNNPRLVTLALQVRLDAFTKVKKAIDDMIAELLTEKKDEIKMKDFCREAFNENQRNTEDKEREKKGLEETIDGLTITIEELTKALETLKAEIAEMKIQKKRAGEDREIENKEFQGAVADQRAAQKLLVQALNVLKGFYDKKAKAALLQKAKQTPPVAFKAYKKNKNSGGVMGMIQMIIDDAKAAEAETIRAEADAQKAYETFVKDTNAGITEREKAIVMKTEAKAKAEDEKTKSEQTLEEVVQELDGLSQEAADLHHQCDFVMKNFEIRQTARDQEIEALRMVKQILSGAKFSEFLQSEEFAGADQASAAQDESATPDGADPLQYFLDQPN